MAIDATRALRDILRVLSPVMDIVEGRVDEPEPPPWCARRGWAAFLLSLDEEELRRCEAEGLAERLPRLEGAPEDLVALGQAVSEKTRLPMLSEALWAPRAALRAVSVRKQEQLAALLGTVATMASSSARIVDVGAGSGHFTRLSAELFGREALGIEREPARVVAASARARELGAKMAHFVAMDACREELMLSAEDLAVGLHACGEVGDRLVMAAGEVGCDLVLVSCCLQKIGEERRAPLSQAGRGFVLRRESLGLANLSAQAQGVEASMEAMMDARRARYALYRLLRERGVEIAPGGEMRGINRRRAHGGLRELAARALSERGLRPASEDEIRRHEEEARIRHGAIRRISLPRSMLSRLLEVGVILDRAALLAEKGLFVEMATLFEKRVSPRNIGLFASRDARRLPSALQ